MTGANKSQIRTISSDARHTKKSNRIRVVPERARRSKGEYKPLRFTRKGANPSLL